MIVNWTVRAIHTLKNDGTVLMPTDTVWGLGAVMTSSIAIQKIEAIKQRSMDKNFLLLVADFEMLTNYVNEINPIVVDFLNTTQRATTVIYPNPKNIPTYLLAKDGSIGIRIVKEKWLSDFIQLINEPIISTSANISGQPTAADFHSIPKKIKEQVDFIFPELEKNNRQTSSQIIRLDENEKIAYIRK